MKIGQQIKKHRNEQSLSQEMLAERIYVSRQTISNWENGKSYPDIHSLILLSEVFQTSIDNLIKGDVEEMKIEINQAEVKKMNFYSAMILVLMALAVLSSALTARWLEYYALIPFVVFWLCAMYFAFKVEKIKKKNNIQTYKEIVAFTEGKKLDEITQIQEKAKRPYQKILIGIIAVIIGLILGFLVGFFC